MASGITNVVLDALFLVVWQWGLIGAGLATLLSQIVAFAISGWYFSSGQSHVLMWQWQWFWDVNVLVTAMTNGLSEMIESMAVGLVGTLYNYQLMHWIGSHGVIAYGIIMYISMIFNAIYMGYATGISPAISYAWGEGNVGNLKNLLKKSVVIVLSLGVAMLSLAYSMRMPLAILFVKEDQALLELVVYAIGAYGISYLFSGFSIFGSCFFTALHNGRLSASIAFLRAFVFEVGCILVLPYILGGQGIWFAIGIAEACSFIFTGVLLVYNRKKYKY